MWTFIALAPDGRELARETGGRPSEARIHGVVDRYNMSMPWHARQRAYVKVVPSYLGG